MAKWLRQQSLICAGDTGFKSKPIHTNDLINIGSQMTTSPGIWLHWVSVRACQGHVGILQLGEMAGCSFYQCGRIQNGLRRSVPEIQEVKQPNEQQASHVLKVTCALRGW